MNCRDVQEHLIEAVYGELPADLQTTFQSHLDGCDECREAYQGLVHAHEALDLLPGEVARIDLARLYHDARARSVRSRVHWRRAALATAAALLLAVGVAVWRGRIEVGPDGIAVSWRDTTESRTGTQPPGVDASKVLADHARHLATLDETIALLLAELDASERQRVESLAALRRQIQTLQWRNSSRIELVQRDLRDLYLASFSASEDGLGDRP